MAKREPLRIPQAWKDQARAFVIQLERVLDDVYNRFFANKIPMSDTDATTISEAFSALDSTVNITNDILADALTVTKTTFFRASNTTNYTGSVPSNSYKKGVFIVNRRISGRFVLAISDAKEMAVNYYNGTSWSGWRNLAFTDIHGLSESTTTAATNLNNCTYAGTYLYNPDTLNIPYAGYGLCFVVATNDPSSTGVGWVNQIAITTKTDPDVWVRKRINNGSWTSWQCISTTASAAALNSRTNVSTPTLYRCTGTIGNNICYHLSGNTMIIEGRLTINDYVRTGANPGLTVTIPNSKKLKRGFTSNCGLTWSSNSNEGVRANEMLNIIGVADSTTFMLQTTETYTNMASATRVTFTIFPVAFEVY